jgi:flagellar biosynthesis protein FlhF
MRLKSYFAATVEAAVSQARKELGEDALLMTSRKAPVEARHLGEYEVVFAAAQDPVAPGPTPVDGPSPERWDRLAQEVSELRRQIERASSALARSTALAHAAAHQTPGWSEALSDLIAAEVPADLAIEIVEAARARCLSRPAGEHPDRVRAALASEISSRVTVESSLGRPGAARSVVALVGPPGAGKTTTLVKLAATYGLAARRPAQILSMDTTRIAAAEQLRVCAGILGIGFQVLETTGALAQALEEHRPKDLILIDTPGFGPKDIDHGLDLALYLSTHPEMDTHLVLTATTKSADLSRAVDRFEIFGPRKLLFTRLDETDAFGSILALAERTKKPVSFLAAGQQIPEDLEPAGRERIVDLLIGRPAAAALAAA